MADLLERAAARVLLLDGRDRLLLFHGGDPARPENGSWWITPGGGLEVGEDAQAAAVRELREETGLSGVALAGPVWRRVAEFQFEGQDYRQSEVFFVARVDSHEVDTSGFDELEQRSVVGHRWWSIDEMDAAEDVIYPRRLAAELRRLLEDGVPETPYEVGE